LGMTQTVPVPFSADKAGQSMDAIKSAIATTLNSASCSA
jgi:hypothetical protein